MRKVYKKEVALWNNYDAHSATDVLVLWSMEQVWSNNKDETKTPAKTHIPHTAKGNRWIDGKK